MDITDTGGRCRIAGSQGVLMPGAVKHPDIRFVVYPAHPGGTLTGAKPRLRHYPGCGHFEWGDGTLLGAPVMAAEEQSRTLSACKTRVKSRGGSSEETRQQVKEGGAGGLCCTCNQMLPLAGRCDNCAD